jgi:hypothetical protein
MAVNYHGKKFYNKGPWGRVSTRLIQSFEIAVGEP